MKKWILFCGLIILLFLYQLVFSYRLIPFPNSGGLKHKTFGVFLFPYKHFLLFNPIRTDKIRSLILDYLKSGEYQLAVEQKFPSKTRFAEVYFTSIEQMTRENIELASIKYEDERYHILVRNRNNHEFTIVFLLDPQKDEIIDFY